jgi:hypothetical protein
MIGSPANLATSISRGSWWHLFQNRWFEGGRTHRVDAPLEEIPMFPREGAIPPLAFDGESRLGATMRSGVKAPRSRPARGGEARLDRDLSGLLGCHRARSSRTAEGCLGTTSCRSQTGQTRSPSTAVSACWRCSRPRQSRPPRCEAPHCSEVSQLSRCQARHRRVLPGSGAKGWPLQDDHVRISEGDIARWISGRMKVIDRSWRATFLTLLIEKTWRGHGLASFSRSGDAASSEPLRCLRLLRRVPMIRY